MREARKDEDGWSNLISYGILDYEWRENMKLRLERKMELNK
jgi:hypothetical protein